MSSFRSLLAAFLLLDVAAAATPLQTAPQQPPPTPETAPPAPAPTAPPDDGKRDVVSIARREAERESVTLINHVRDLLRELRSSSDSGLAFIENKIKEIASIGSPAVDVLIEAMDYPEQSAPAQNAGINAARALARIPGQKASSAIARICREGGVHGRRNGALAIGLRGDVNLQQALKDLLSDKDASVVEQALLSIGWLRAEGGTDLLLPFLKSTDPTHAAAAIRGIALSPAIIAPKEVIERFRAGMAKQPVEDPVLRATMDYLEHHPLAEAAGEAQQIVQNAALSAELRVAAARALLEIAKAHDNTRKGALAALDAALATAGAVLVEELAAAMKELGDETGVKKVTAELDAAIEQDAKDFNSRYQRADIFVRFGNWKEAKRDYLEGLKLERDPRSPERVYLPLARACAALKQYPDAAKYLSKLEGRDLSQLPEQYPEFKRMAADNHYEKVFAPSGK